MQRKWIYVMLIIIIGGLGMGRSFFGKKDAVSEIENKLNISVSRQVSIVEEQQKTQYGENHLAAKLKVKKGSVEEVRMELERSLGPGKALNELSIIPNFQNTCAWWDLDQESVFVSYHRMMSGKRAKTIEIWAFLSHLDGEDYLYISY